MMLLISHSVLPRRIAARPSQVLTGRVTVNFARIARSLSSRPVIYSKAAAIFLVILYYCCVLLISLRYAHGYAVSLVIFLSYLFHCACSLALVLLRLFPLRLFAL
jgi:hypothetical protein